MSISRNLVVGPERATTASRPVENSTLHVLIFEKVTRSIYTGKVIRRNIVLVNNMNNSGVSLASQTRGAPIFLCISFVTDKGTHAKPDTYLQANSEIIHTTFYENDLELAPTLKICHEAACPNSRRGQKS